MNHFFLILLYTTLCSCSCIEWVKNNAKNCHCQKPFRSRSSQSGRGWSCMLGSIPFASIVCAETFDLLDLECPFGTDPFRATRARENADQTTVPPTINEETTKPYIDLIHNFTIDALFSKYPNYRPYHLLRAAEHEKIFRNLKFKTGENGETESSSGTETMTIVNNGRQNQSKIEHPTEMHNTVELPLALPLTGFSKRQRKVSTQLEKRTTGKNPTTDQIPSKKNQITTTAPIQLKNSSTGPTRTRATTTKPSNLTVPGTSVPSKAKTTPAPGSPTTPVTKFNSTKTYKRNKTSTKPPKNSTKRSSKKNSNAKSEVNGNKIKDKIENIGVMKKIWNIIKNPYVVITAVVSVSLTIFIKMCKLISQLFSCFKVCYKSCFYCRKMFHLKTQGDRKKSQEIESQDDSQYALRETQV